MAQFVGLFTVQVIIGIQFSIEVAIQPPRNQTQMKATGEETTWFYVHSSKNNKARKFLELLKCTKLPKAKRFRCAWSDNKKNIRRKHNGFKLASKKLSINKDRRRQKHKIWRDADDEDNLAKPDEWPKHHLVKRQARSNSRFKPLGNSEGESSGMSTLVIVGIVIGALLGLLILVFILRKMLARNKKKNIDKKSLANSGTPKMNMTRDKIVKAKQGILSPDVVVANKDFHLPLPIKRQPSQLFHELSSSYGSEDKELPPDYRKVITAEDERKPVARNFSYRSERGVRHVNGAARNDSEARFHRSPSQRECKTSGKRGRSSPEMLRTRKTPYRYNDHRTRGVDQKGAIEALNNEKFCEYGNFHRVQTLPQAKHVIPVRESRSFVSHRRPNAESMRRISSTVALSLPRRQKQLPGQQYPIEGGQNRISSSYPKKWNESGKSLGNPSPHLADKRRSTIDEDRLVSRKEDSRRRPDRRSKNISEETFKTDGLMITRSRMDVDPPSPILPRHVVPASRG